MTKATTWLRRGASLLLVAGSLAVTGVAIQIAGAGPAAAFAPGTGSISGTVTVAGGATPAVGVCLNAEFSDGTVAPTVMTAANGTYAIPNLPGGTYFITFYDGPPCVTTAANYADTFYNATPSGTMVGASATLVTVVSGVNTPNINGQMSPGGMITGTVTSIATGAPIAGVCVEATWTNGSADVEFVFSDGSGNYRLYGLDPNVAYTVTVGPNSQCSHPSGFHSATTVVSSAATPLGFSVVRNVSLIPSNSYDLVGSDGGVFVFGAQGYFGSLPGIGVHVNNVVGIVPSSDDMGYFLVGSDGGVFAFGDAPFENSLPGIGVHVNNIVGIVPTGDDRGYFLVGSDGGVFAFGDAPFENSLPGSGVHVSNIVGIAPTFDNAGYWVVSSTGTVYNFGDAPAFGSVVGANSPVVGIAPTNDGLGYWVVTANGSVFTFGDAAFHNSLPGLGVAVGNIVSIVPTGDGGGYWLIGSDGGVFAFGDAPNVGSLPGIGVRVNNVVGAVPTA